MSPYVFACIASERVDAAVSHPAAFPCFCVATGLCAGIFGMDATNFVISVVTAGLLFIMATAQAKQSTRMARQLEELAKASPDVDDKAIDEEVG